MHLRPLTAEPMSPHSLKRTIPLAAERMLEDVRAGLASEQKELAPTYFYDANGSTLFEQITLTPEYYLTRAERALLEREAASIALAAGPRSFAELGAGNAEKSRILIRALRARGLGEAYVPVDVDRATLAETAASLRGEFPELDVIPVVADMRGELRIPPAAPRPLLCAFLGSTLGNFSAAESQLLLSLLRGEIGRDGWLLLGADLVKDAATIERAYNDAEGLTARFNLNVLSVLNRELGADFVLAAFEHHAFYEPRLRRIEMHLVSRAKQRRDRDGVKKSSFDVGLVFRRQRKPPEQLGIKHQVPRQIRGHVAR